MRNIVFFIKLNIEVQRSSVQFMVAVPTYYYILEQSSQNLISEWIRSQ